MRHSTLTPPTPSDVIFISKVRRSKEKEEEPHLVERTKVSSMKLTWMENTAESKQKKSNIGMLKGQRASTGCFKSKKESSLTDEDD